MEITRDYIEIIRQAVENKEKGFLGEQLQNLHPADVAQLLKELQVDESRYLFFRLEKDKAGEVLVELVDPLREELLSGFHPREILERFIGGMDSDDAADFINELPGPVQDELVSYLGKSEDPAHREVFNLLWYPEDSAGGLMATELIRVNVNWTVEQCISEIRRQAEEVESIYAVYVEDDHRILKGYVPLPRLIQHQPEVKMSQIYDKEVIYVWVDTPGDEVASIMRKYDLAALPVVDKKGRLAGRITFDDVMDFEKEEAEEDYQLMSGISEGVVHTDKIWVLSRARLPWLLLGLLGGVASAKLISLNEGAIQVYPEMAFFIPLIAAMGGNAGVQSSAIIVQGLASKTLQTGRFFSKIFKEMSVALINGLLCSTILMAYGYFLLDTLKFSMVVSISLLVVIVIASTLGLAIPLLLDKLNIDPALATGPFITTTNDLIGLGVYFLVGHFLYSLPF